MMAKKAKQRALNSIEEKGKFGFKKNSALLANKHTGYTDTMDATSFLHQHYSGTADGDNRLKNDTHRLKESKFDKS